MIKYDEIELCKFKTYKNADDFRFDVYKEYNEECDIYTSSDSAGDYYFLKIIK